MRDLLLRHPGGETPIRVGQGALAAAAGTLGGWLAARTVFLVSTPRVLALHGERLAWIPRHAAREIILTVPEGEEAKTLAHAEALWQQMLAAGGKRDSRVVAFGGGSVCDLAGFAAGAFLRGVEVAQLPTTLLAQVDAAIGGKTGVDLPAGKNTVGLFHHPAAVVSDTEVLATLPRRELAAGLVEVVKMALVLDPELFARVEQGLEPLLAGNPAALEPVVAATAAAKVKVVEKDPAEGGYRRVLNLGHTLGHALETVTGYRALLHGEAVAHGLRFALRLAERRGLDSALAGRVRSLLGRLVPRTLAEACEEALADGSLSSAALLAAIGRDKKAREGGVAWVLPTGLGRFEIVDVAGEEELRGEIEAFLAEERAG